MLELNMEKMYFDYNQIKKEVTSSWARCLRQNKNRKLDIKNKTNNKNTSFKREIKGSLRKYFLKMIKEINQKLITDSCFFLINRHYIIEEVVADNKIITKLKDQGIRKGFCFSEKNSGTNAVFLSKKLKRPVYMLPGHHYCCPLNYWYSISYPIIIENKIYSFLNVVSEDIIDNDIICAVELLVDNIQLKLTNQKEPSEFNFRNKKLSDKQISILKMIASGWTEQAVARNLNLSKSTVKYHKKKLFNFFNARSNIEVVLKAIKNGFLTLNEVGF